MKIMTEIDNVQVAVFYYLKLVFAIFYQIFIFFNQMIALQKL